MGIYSVDVQETRIDPPGRRWIRSFLPRWDAVATAPVAGAVTLIPIPLQAIHVPAFTFGITAVDPVTLIVAGVDPLLYASVADPPFSPEPQPATAKPRTASSASAMSVFTGPLSYVLGARASRRRNARLGQRPLT